MGGVGEMLGTFASNFPALQLFINLITLMAGIILGGIGVWAMTLGARQGSRLSTIGGAVSTFMGGLLVSMPTTMSVLTNSFFESATPRDVFSYSPPSGGGGAALAVSVVLGLLTLMGWYWGLKACLLIHAGCHPAFSKQGDEIKRGLWMLAGAVMAVNALVVTDAIAWSFGIRNPLSEAMA